MIRSLALVAGMAVALAGCAGGAAPAPVRPVTSAAAPRSSSVVRPQVMSPAGLDGVIGSPAAAITRRFGTPRIDLAEGDARKLQFAGESCVLDIYLYPVSAAAAEPTATHVVARLRQGGAATDPGTCLREVERR